MANQSVAKRRVLFLYVLVVGRGVHARVRNTAIIKWNNLVELRTWPLSVVPLERLVVSTSLPTVQTQLRFPVIIIGLRMSLFTYFQKLSNQKEQTKFSR